MFLHLVAILLLINNFSSQDNPPPSKCVDTWKKEDCLWFKNKDYCERPDLKGFLYSRCARTCMYCRECIDRWRTEFCLMIKDKGICDLSIATRHTLAENCTKTCGYCKEVMESPPRRRLRPKRRRG